jgi:hypothetical protein
MHNRFWSGSSARSTARWVISLPLLLVGSMMFWTMALGSGAISLLAVAGLSQASQAPQIVDDDAAQVEPGPTSAEPAPGHALGSPANPILVHLQESAEPEDVNDNLGAVAPGEADQAQVQGDDDGTGQMSGQAP